MFIKLKIIKNKITLLLLAITTIMAACNTQKRELEKRKEEVLFIHDKEAMPQMGKLVELTKQLNEIRNKMGNLPEPDSLILTKIDEGVAQLKAADKNMMDWMQQFKMEPEGGLQEQIKYFEAEKIKIKEVENLMLKSMQNAETLLQTYRPEM